MMIFLILMLCHYLIRIVFVFFFFLFLVILVSILANKLSISFGNYHISRAFYAKHFGTGRVKVMHSFHISYECLHKTKFINYLRDFVLCSHFSVLENKIKYVCPQ